MINLKATSMEYEFEDEGGYKFTVSAYLDPGRGWSASVSMRDHGLISAEAAIKGLERSVRAFLRMLEKDEVPA